MHARLLTSLLAASLLALTACDIEDFDTVSKYNRDFHYNYPMKPDGRLEVETFNGSVDISGWDQATVDISGTKYGPTQDEADSLRVDIGNSPEAISVRVVRPSDRRNHEGARLVIKVPRGAVLDRIVTSNGAIRTMDGAGPARLHTSNGSIRVQDLRGSLNVETSNDPVELSRVDGDVTVHTTNGHIRVEEVSGAVEAHTSNSSVNLKIERADKPVRVETSNDPVELSLPAGFASNVRVNTSNSGITIRVPTEPNARMIARTSNGSITSEFDMRVQGEISKNRLDGTLGHGGGLMELTTSNSNIRLVKM
jgi:DUF4097 and DUF4098 domain-containing protein YvlB